MSAVPPPTSRCSGIPNVSSGSKADNVEELSASDQKPPVTHGGRLSRQQSFGETAFLCKNPIIVVSGTHRIRVFRTRLVAISIAASGTAVAGIEIGAPLVSGDVATVEHRHEASRKKLSQTELQALSQWLALHKTGWRGMITEPSSEPAALRFSLKDSKGRTGSISVVVGLHGGYYLQFVSSSEKWSYQSSVGLFKSWAATHALSAEDLSQLLRAVDIQDLPK